MDMEMIAHLVEVLERVGEAERADVYGGLVTVAAVLAPEDPAAGIAEFNRLVKERFGDE